ncbi:hypothetical protein AGMMS49949_06060 [Alphaproteobacteria bacterium]|nr:hypothetical protein AGMMS49949_06060 [Alphaproteobacteria bacterium]GHS97869.1 hypothetical protein AGMMS50296_5170 [Alphaproteobacteria bacterium]
MAVPSTKIFKFPGRSALTLPINEPKKDEGLSGISKSTPEWVISFDALLEAHLTIPRGKGFPAASIELFEFTHDTTRETLGHSSNQLVAFTATRHSDLNVTIQNDSYAPVLEQYMNNGTCINRITITRLGWIQGAIQLLEERTFKMCNITQFTQILDYIVLSIRYIDREEIVHIYKQETALPAGECVSMVSASTNAITLT